MSLFADMIKQYRERKGYSQEEFAKKLNVSQSAVSDWEKGVTTPRPKRLKSIATALDMHVDALLNAMMYHDLGKSTGNFQQTAGNVVRPESNARSVQPNIKELYRELPFASIKAQAGIPESYEGCQLNWISETYPVYIRNYIANKQELVIEIDGDSMTPEIKDGAHVLAEAVSKDNIKYESGGVYAVLFGNGRFVIKRIKTNTINTEGMLRLWSDNEQYGHIDVPANEIHCMWKVVAKVFEPMK